MIEPNYDSLSTQQLQQLCTERKIEFDISMPYGKLIDMLVDHDWEKCISQLNPE